MVYSLPCEEPPDVYIGQTKQNVKVRICEHERPCEGDPTKIQPNATNDKGIPIHCASTRHIFLFEQTIVLAREPNYFRRKIIEGIHILNKSDSCAHVSIKLQVLKLTRVGIRFLMDLVLHGIRHCQFCRNSCTTVGF